MPKVSIIVPVFNAEKTLNRCLDSLISQTYTDIEIIIVNDGSTDNSLEVCKSYQSKYPYVHIIDQNNSGPATARNKGIETANGKYLSFVDADDYVESNMISEMLNAAETNQAQMVICGYYQEFAGKIKKHEFSYEPGLYTGNDSKKIAMDLICDVSNTRIPPYSWVRMVLKDALENPRIRYEDGMIRSEDYYFYTQLHFRTERLYLLTDKPLYHYMELSSSVTHGYVPDYWNSVAEIYSGLQKALPDEEEIKKRLDTMFVQRSLIALNNAARCNNRHKFKSEIFQVIKDTTLQSVIKDIKVMDGVKKFKFYYLLMKIKFGYAIYFRYLVKYSRNKRTQDSQQ